MEVISLESTKPAQMVTQKATKQALFSFARISIAFLAILGAGIMVYLTYIHYANTRSFCDLSETISCDVVTTSIYSEIFGLPISILGLGYFGSALLLTVFYRKKEYFQVLFLLTFFVLIPSLYFSILEATVIGAWCVLCETSKLLMITILAISLQAMKQKFSVVARMAFPVLIAGVVAAGVTYFAQTGNVVKKDYTIFVQSLNERGVVYYKSVKCNNCKRQEKLFGESIKKLNSVECHPDGENPQPELCLTKGIKKTPTFLIEMGGVEVKRLEGLQQLDDLANWAAVPFED